MKIKPELLSPAGSLKHLRFAHAYGADAVYAGQPRYSLRVRNNEFNLENLAIAREESRQRGKKLYVAANIAPHNSKIKTFIKDLEPIIELAPDALIMSDPGLIMLVRDRWPEQAIHLSVQSNVTNYASAQFWQRQGIERIILSRELSLNEVQEIQEQCPGLEFEVFVHGALCIAYSGRCLLSGYFNHRDPNQGTCTNACRWQYNVHEAKETAEGDIIAIQKPNEGQKSDEAGDVHLLQEANRPGEYMPIYEDEHGTYIMNSKDLRAVQHVEKFVKMGMHSLKIEGRTKSFYYVARTAQVYRQAIDDAYAGRDFNRFLMDELEKLASRGYTEGFYRRHVHDEYQAYERGHSVGLNQQFVAEIDDYDAGSNTLKVQVKNRFECGDELELLSPDGNVTFRLEAMENLQGKAQNIAPGSGHTVRIKLPFDAPSVSEFSLLCRNLG